MTSDGVDEVRSGPGNDSIEFTHIDVATFGGSDFIDAGDGDDTIVKAGLALEVNDVLAGAGNDTVTITGSSEDHVSGSSGNDTLNAGPTKDSVSGGNGDDTIDSGSGNDTVNGGAGQAYIESGIVTSRFARP